MNGWTLTFVFRRDRVLLIRRHPAKRVFPGLVNGVGGKVEAHDATVIGAARRELGEETGLIPEELLLRGGLVFHRRYRDGRPDDRGVVYLFTCERFTGRARRRCPEGDLFWCPLNQVEAQPLTPELRAYWPRLIERPPRPIHVYSEYLDDQSVALQIT